MNLPKTRAMVEREIQERLRARQQLQQLKDKLPGGGSTAEMPDFKPKDLKSKTFLQRI